MSEPLTSVDPALVYEYAAGRVPATTPGLQRRIDAVLDDIRHYCGWMPFPQREETFVLNGHGQYPLFLPAQHLESLTSVKVGNEDVIQRVEWGHNGQLNLHGREDWDAEPYNYCPMPWPKRLRSIEVKATVGFALTDCLNLVGTVCDLVARAATNPLAETMTKVGERQSARGVAAGGVVTATRPLGPELAIWDGYRLAPRTWEGG